MAMYNLSAGLPVFTYANFKIWPIMGWDAAPRKVGKSIMCDSYYTEGLGWARENQLSKCVFPHPHPNGGSKRQMAEKNLHPSPLTHKIIYSFPSHSCICILETGATFDQ